ncbi:MAG: Cytidylyltransferase [uncultured bacterium]|nr:MAG: Cytidylyltransferase [uncultured bacterium]
MSNMKKVLSFGTFDFLHSGHIFTFEKARKLGDTLIVSVARDRAIKKIKGKNPLHTEDERLALVRHIDMVDEAFLGDEELGVYSFFKKFVPDIIALGYDQPELKKDVEAFIATNEYHTICITLPPYKNGKTKSSTIKKSLGL